MSVDDENDEDDISKFENDIKDKVIDILNA